MGFSGLWVLGPVLLVAVATDIRRRRVYNWLTFPAMALGVVLNTLFAHGAGFALAAGGLLVGALLFLPFFLWGGMGAGDIKLMAAVGALQGPVFAVNTAMYASLIGGVLAVMILIWRGELWKTLRRMTRRVFHARAEVLPAEKFTRRQSLPYAVVIALGAVAAQFLPSLIFYSH